MIRIYADENARDEQDRYLLNVTGSQRDIERHNGVLTDGLRVVLNVQDEFEVEATLIFDGVWRAIPDDSTVVFKDEPV